MFFLMISVRTCLLLVPLFILLSCSKRDHCVQFTHTGPTMGTTYTVKGCLPKKDKLVTTSLIVDKTNFVLKEINAKMSTYIPSSEVVKFSKSKKNKWVEISKETSEVIYIAGKISEMSEGAYDITVGPLVNLWGFGPKKSSAVPDIKLIEKIKKEIGYKNIILKMNPYRVIKKFDSVEIDLSSIAKGYAVDKVAEALEFLKINNYMVEIGGEVRAKGHNFKGKGWAIGIEVPSSNDRKVQKIIKISERSIATSGDYRNYFEKNGKRYSHTIDPRTGYPITHNLVSATVVTKKCIEADALATMFSVLGIKDALKLANEKSIAAYFITKEGNKFKEWVSSEFKKMEGQK